MIDLASFIRDIPDFPKPGIVFKDITTLLREPEPFREAIDRLAEPYAGKGIDLVLGIESRGFIIGAAVAYRIHAGLVPVRKPGKLPARTLGEAYDLEYGKDRLEVHADAITKDQSVLIVDDVLATGGTARTAWNLSRQLGAHVVGMAVLLELGFLNGRDKLGSLDVFSLLKY